MNKDAFMAGYMSKEAFDPRTPGSPITLGGAAHGLGQTIGADPYQAGKNIRDKAQGAWSRGKSKFQNVRDFWKGLSGAPAPGADAGDSGITGKLKSRPSEFVQRSKGPAIPPRPLKGEGGNKPEDYQWDPKRRKWTIPGPIEMHPAPYEPRTGK
jgi:hypothetical protein